MQYLKWLKKTGETVKTEGRKEIPVYSFAPKDDAAILSEWAKHFRNHYCLDEKIDSLRDGTGKSRKEFLIDTIFPDNREGFGPRVRSGDFAEVLLADYLEYVLKYWVPRTRFSFKVSRNESVKGCDVIGFKFEHSNKESPDDILMTVETKAALVAAAENRLQEAVNDSAKDLLRRAESLHAIKSRLLDNNDQEGVKKIRRFQNVEDKPFRHRYIAAVLNSSENHKIEAMKKTVTSNHPAESDLVLVAIHGKDLMKLVHALYERAADEAGT